MRSCHLLRKFANNIEKEIARHLSNRNRDGAVKTLLSTLQAPLDSTATVSSKCISSVMHTCEESDCLGDIQQIFESLKDKPHTWNENVLVVMMKVYEKQSRLSDATQLMAYMFSKNMNKRRCIAPFLRTCFQARDGVLLNALYDELHRRGIVLLQEDYELLLQATKEVPGFVPSKEAILRACSGEVEVFSNSFGDICRKVWNGAVREATISSEGVCSSCAVVLQGYQFTRSMREELLSGIVAMESKKGRSFEIFRRFIRNNRPDVIIDGANVGYYGLSKWYNVAKGAATPSEAAQLPKKGTTVDVGLDFELIQKAINAVTERGLSCLVILHSRHMENPQLLSPEKSLRLEQWRRLGQVFGTPRGLYDDVCWLYGAILHSKPSEDSVVRKTYVLTNDAMRDHHFQLLSPKPFMKWRDSHRITFNCERTDGHTAIRLMFPPTYAALIQRNETFRKYHIPLQRSVPSGEREGITNEDSIVEWVCLDYSSSGPA